MPDLPDLLDEAQRLLAERKETGEITERDHECDDGFVYTDSGDVMRCPTCLRNAALERFDDELLNAGIGRRYATIEWSDLELVDPLPQLKRASSAIDAAIAEGDHLLLSGPPGSGKTQAGVLLVKDALRAGHRAWILNLGLTAIQIRGSYDRKDGPTEKTVIDRASLAELLVIDDLGAGESGGAQVEQRLLYAILEQRQNAGRSTVITTNLSPREVADRLGARLFGRLQPLAVFPFRHGRNFRRPTGPTFWERA